MAILATLISIAAGIGGALASMPWSQITRATAKHIPKFLVRGKFAREMAARTIRYGGRSAVSAAKFAGKALPTKATMKTLGSNALQTGAVVGTTYGVQQGVDKWRTPTAKQSQSFSDRTPQNRRLLDYFPKQNYQIQGSNKSPQAAAAGSQMPIATPNINQTAGSGLVKRMLNYARCHAHNKKRCKACKIKNPNKQSLKERRKVKSSILNTRLYLKRKNASHNTTASRRRKGR